MADPHATIAQSATALEASAASQKTSAERTTELAADRTILAERTYAAWVRTGLAALASGIGARALLRDVVAPWLATTAGVTLILFSALCFIAAVWRELTPAYLAPRPDARRLPPALLILVNGVLVLVSLASVVGVLTAGRGGAGRIIAPDQPRRVRAGAAWSMPRTSGYLLSPLPDLAVSVLPPGRSRPFLGEPRALLNVRCSNLDHG